MKQKSLKLNAMLNAVKTVMSLIFPLITFPYSSRVLGPEGTGKVGFASSIVTYFAIIAALGISTYGARELAKIRDDQQKTNKFVKEVFIINLISTIIAYILFFICIFTVPALKDYQSLLLITCANIVFATIGLDWVYTAMEDYLYITIRSIAFQILGVILLFVLVKNESDILQYASLGVITGTGSNVLNFIHVHKYLNLREKTTIELKKHLKPIFILFGTIVAVSLYTILDTTMLGFLVGDEEVGIYNAATRLNRMVVMLVASLGIVASPRMSNYIETNKEKYYELLKAICSFYLILCLPCAAGLCFLAEPIIKILCGEKFIASIPIMQIMTGVVIFIPFGAFFTDQIFTPMRKDKYSLIPVLIGAMVNIICNIIFIPRLKSIGAAIASVFAEFVVTMVKFILSKKLLKTKNNYFVIILQAVVGVTVMLFVLYFFNKYIVLNSIIQLVIDIILGAIVYYVMLLITKNTLAIEYTRRFLHK